jgi:hypothetical protein
MIPSDWKPTIRPSGFGNAQEMRAGCGCSGPGPRVRVPAGGRCPSVRGSGTGPRPSPRASSARACLIRILRLPPPRRCVCTAARYSAALRGKFQGKRHGRTRSASSWAASPTGPPCARRRRSSTSSGVAYEARIVSAHRTPDRLWDYGKTAVDRGLKVIIAGAGGAAHLPGMMASKTRVPVIGVPVQTKALSGVDSLYSIVQMPRGYPSRPWPSARRARPMRASWPPRSSPPTTRVGRTARHLARGAVGLHPRGAQR